MLAAAVLSHHLDVVDRVVFWNARTGEVIATLAQDPGIRDVAVSGAIAYLSATTGSPPRGTVRALEIPSLREIWRRERLDGRLELSTDEATLLVIDARGLIVALATDTGSPRGKIGVNAMLDAVPVGSTRDIITVGAGSGIVRHNLDRPREDRVVREPAHDHTPSRLAVSGDGRTRATMNYGTIEVIDLATNQTRWEYQRGDGAGLAIGGPNVVSVHLDPEAPVTTFSAVIHRLDGTGTRLGEIALAEPSDRLLEPAVAVWGDSLAVVDAGGAVVVRELRCD
jgi:outer membrane protein assembly factor BamB